MRIAAATLTLLLAAMTAGMPDAVRAEFTAGHLIVVNDPSAFSQDVDPLVELDPTGTFVKTLVPTSENITGMSRVVFDPVSGHVFYSVSFYPNATYEIR